MKELEQILIELENITENIYYVLSCKDETEIRKNVLNDAILNLEKLAVKSRKNYVQEDEFRRNYLKKLVNKFDIEVKKIDYGVTIKMPSLISKKKIYNNDFLCEPLSHALEYFVRKFKFQKFKECVLIFNHIYEKETKIMDYDNLEIKSVIDNISLFLLEDDSGKYIDLYHTSEIKDKNYLQIYLMEKDKFIGFLELNNKLK